MKKLTVLFSFGVFGICFCLVMTIVTAFQVREVKQVPSSHRVPVPALGNS